MIYLIVNYRFMYLIVLSVDIVVKKNKNRYVKMFEVVCDDVQVFMLFYFYDEEEEVIMVVFDIKEKI